MSQIQRMPREIELLQQAAAWLAECQDLDEIKKLRDKAESLRLYMSKQKASLESVNAAGIIKVRAERRIGEISSELEKSVGGRPNEKTLPNSGRVSKVAVLAEAGISTSVADRCEAIFDIPEEEFEAEIERTVKAGKRTTSSAMQKKARDLDRKAKRDELQANPPKKIEGDPPGLVLADPPWQYDFSETDERQIENQYPTEPTEQIVGMAPKTAANCVLFMWATAPKLLDALRVMEGWGFEYRTHAMWDKQKIGMGYWFRGQHELILVGTKGKPRAPAEEDRVGSVFREIRKGHSAKPECVYAWIEKAFPGVVKLEMFARRQRSGWEAWGNETEMAAASSSTKTSK